MLAGCQYCVTNVTIVINSGHSYYDIGLGSHVTDQFQIRAIPDRQIFSLHRHAQKHRDMLLLLIVQKYLKVLQLP